MKATRDFQSAVLGYVRKGDPIPDDAHGQHLASVGLAAYDTKVVRDEPTTRTKVKARGAKRKDTAAG